MKKYSPLKQCLRSVLLSALVISPLASWAHEHHYRYEGDVYPTEAEPLWRESKKNGGGKVSLNNGKLRLEVSDKGRQFYVIDTPNGADSGAGTVDFSVKVAAENDTDEPFGIRVGSGEGSINIVFRSHAIVVDGKVLEADCSEPDVYRIFYSKGAFSFYSAKRGALLEKGKISTRYPVEGISFGTRQGLNFSDPVSWELDFIRWTYQEMPFDPLKSE